MASDLTDKELARWIASEAGNDNPTLIAVEVWAAAIRRFSDAAIRAERIRVINVLRGLVPSVMTTGDVIDAVRADYAAGYDMGKQKGDDRCGL